MKPAHTGSLLMWVLFCVALGVLEVVLPGSRVEAAEGEPGPVRRDDAPGRLAERIVRLAGIDTGLCVHLGSSDGRMTAELANHGRFVVHGLAVTREAAETSRRHIASRGLHGKVSVEHGVLSRLPYVENLVNLVVVDDLGQALKHGLSLAEVVRVLCPGGVAHLEERTDAGAPALREDELKAKLTEAGIADFKLERHDGGLHVQFRKPRPAETDEWTHWLHGPECNNLSSDAVTGPAARLQWIDGPTWLTGANVSELFADGRSFNVVQDIYYKPRWARIIGRDAYNGLVLWTRDIETAGQAFSPRLVVAVADRVFTVLENDGPLVALDAASGEVVRTYDVGMSPKSVFFHDGHLILAAGRELCSVNAETGEVRWRVAASAQAPFVLEPTNVMRFAVGKKPYVVAGGGRLFVFVRDTPEPPFTLVCFELTSGEEKWRKQQPGELVAYYRGAVLLYDLRSGPTKEGHGSAIYYALSAEDGRSLWERKHLRRSNHPDEPCYAGGLVWVSDEADRGRCLNGIDVLTGEEKRDLARGTWGHCGRLITTERYMIGKMTELVSFETGKHFGLGFYKNGCGVGQVPANGMLYTFPISCSCISYIRGFVAFAPGPAYRPGEPAAGESERLEKGPAYGFSPARPTPGTAPHWNTYRHDNRRSGAATEALPRELKLLWSRSVAEEEGTRYGKSVTPPVVAEGNVFVATPDAHAVCALDAETGELHWRYLLDGRAEVPPTVFRGLCLFGANDGRVYCVRAADGELVWRFRAAPEEQRIMVGGRLESPWPVPGVLVENGVAYFAAGRHAKTNDGIHVYAMDPFTGKVLWETRVDNTKPETWYDNHPNDLLISDGTSLFMCQLRFDLKTGEKHRTWFKGKSYTHQYLLSGQGRDTSAVFPFGFLYDRSDGASMQRYDSTWWYYRGAEGFTLSFTGDRVFGVAAKRMSSGPWELFARRPDGPDPAGAEPVLWTVRVPRDSVQALLPAGRVLFVAGRPDEPDAGAGVLRTYSADDGSQVSEVRFADAPVFDGLAAADGRLYVSTRKGSVFCFTSRHPQP